MGYMLVIMVPQIDIRILKCFNKRWWVMIVPPAHCRINKELDIRLLRCFTKRCLILFHEY